MLHMPYNEFQLQLFVQPVLQDGNKEQMLFVDFLMTLNE